MLAKKKKQLILTDQCITSQNIIKIHKYLIYKIITSIFVKYSIQNR